MDFVSGLSWEILPRQRLRFYLIQPVFALTKQIPVESNTGPTYIVHRYDVSKIVKRTKSVRKPMFRLFSPCGDSRVLTNHSIRRLLPYYRCLSSCLRVHAPAAALKLRKSQRNVPRSVYSDSLNRKLVSLVRNGWKPCQRKPNKTALLRVQGAWCPSLPHITHHTNRIDTHWCNVCTHCYQTTT